MKGMVFSTKSDIETTLGPPTIANPYITRRLRQLKIMVLNPSF